MIAASGMGSRGAGRRRGRVTLFPEEFGADGIGRAQVPPVAVGEGIVAPARQSSDGRVMDPAPDHVRIPRLADPCSQAPGT